MQGDIIIVKSGGDIASAVIQKLHRSGFRVLVLELPAPTSIRRTVCFSEAVYGGKATIEGLTAILVNDKNEIIDAWNDDFIPIIIDKNGNYIEEFKPIAVVDAIIAKKNLGMNKDLAPMTIAIGPGFEAGKDVHIVIESNRGHNLGKLIFEGFAESNTGKPGDINGCTCERVLHSPVDGIFISEHNIGDIVTKGEVIASVAGENVYSQIDGLLRGLIRKGTPVTKGFKLGDVDPRLEQLKNCYTISDKARAIAGGVLEAVMIEKNGVKRQLLG